MDGEVFKTACPHDCPGACALEVERLSPTRIGAVRGARGFSFTDGVICAKVARYAERVHHPDRLAQPLRRIGAKGEGRFAPVAWDAALDEIAEAFIRATQQHGSQSVWPYSSGGTLGIVMRWGLDRLRNVMRYSRQKSTICIGASEAGWRAGVGKLVSPDPREMAQSDLIVAWGGNFVATHVNAMTHIQRARKTRGATLVAIDCYRTPTIEAADIGLVLRPGTDGALACAVMHVLLKEGFADRAYLARLTDFDETVERHLMAKTPAWAAAITGLDEQEIVDFARLYGRTPRSYLRLGIGFTRHRNGAVTMHAVSCLPAVTGAWQYEGGGAFYLNLENWGLDLKLAHGTDLVDPAIRALDQSRIGPILCGDKDALLGGPPVMAMLVQNANSANVAPDSRAVRQGLTRDDLFLAVHEQFMTETAQCADIVLPATTFLEHDDMYMGWGHTALTVGPRVIEPYAEARSNHDVVCGLAKRLGADHPGFTLEPAAIIDRTLKASGKGSWEAAKAQGWIECAAEFRRGHFLEGFPTKDGRFHFKPDWPSLGPNAQGMPALPDHWDVLEGADAQHPFKLVAPPSRSFLNTTFTETGTSRKREGRPTLLVHPEDAKALGLADGTPVAVGNRRGQVALHARPSGAVKRGTVVTEGIWPGRDFADGMGVNQLIGADPIQPAGGVGFHDTAVWVRAG